MVDSELFDKLDVIAKNIKKNTLPFGGIQVIATGDFFQLPPVQAHNSITKFAFEANAWLPVITKTILLKKVWRQADEEFVDILNEMRSGKISEHSLTILKSLDRKLKLNDEIEPTQLYAFDSFICFLCYFILFFNTYFTLCVALLHAIKLTTLTMTAYRVSPDNVMTTSQKILVSTI